MKHSRISELDGLRGVACCVVLMHHAFPVQLFWGWLAMEGFFTLSGFLITTILLRIDLTQPIAIRNFLIRRTIRIWPVYFLALASAFAIWLAFNWRQPELYGDMIWWKTLFFLQFSEGYWQPGETGYLFQYALWFRPSWSLAVEEQYYILWPALIMLARGRRGVMLAFCIALVAIGFYMRESGYALNLLLTRGDGFAVGSAMALLQESLPQRSERFRQAAVWIYAAAFAAGVLVCGQYIASGYVEIRSYSDILSYGDWTTNVFFAALLAAGIIGLFRNGQLDFARRALSIKPLIYMGEISLAVYLFQDQVFTVFRTLAQMLELPHGFYIEAIAIVSSVIVGDLSRRLVEGPINRFKRLFPAITPDGKVAEVISAEPVASALTAMPGVGARPASTVA
ncbi:MAG TPA: acyltransferase [Fontimonas sp.]